MIKDCLLAINKLNVETTNPQKKVEIGYLRKSTESFVRKSSCVMSVNTFKPMNTVNFKIDELDDNLNDMNADNSDEDENFNCNILKKRNSIKNKNNTIDFYNNNIDKHFKNKYKVENKEEQDLN